MKKGKVESVVPGNYITIQKLFLPAINATNNVLYLSFFSVKFSDFSISSFDFIKVVLI